MFDYLADPANLDGSVLSYVFYWLAVIAALVYMKFKEVRYRPMLVLFSKRHLLGTYNTLRERIRGWCSPSRQERESRS